MKAKKFRFLAHLIILTDDNTKYHHQPDDTRQMTILILEQLLKGDSYCKNWHILYHDAHNAFRNAAVCCFTQFGASLGLYHSCVRVSANLCHLRVWAVVKLADLLCQPPLLGLLRWWLIGKSTDVCLMVIFPGASVRAVGRGGGRVALDIASSFSLNDRQISNVVAKSRLYNLSPLTHFIPSTMLLLPASPPGFLLIQRGIGENTHPCLTPVSFKPLTQTHIQSYCTLSSIIWTPCYVDQIHQR